MNQGVIYVAWGQKYVAEAIRSASSHQFPSILITDQQGVSSHFFSEIMYSDFSQYVGKNPFYRKMEAIRQTPFDITLFADSDLLISGNIDFGFQQAARHGFAAAIAPGQMFNWEGRDFVHFNGGLLFFRGQPHPWADAVLSFAPTFPTCDEPAWSLAWDQLDVNPVALPEVFNHIPFAKLHPRKIRVWHSRSDQSYHFL